MLNLDTHIVVYAPADELIAATSVVHGVPLVTRDRRLLASRIVPLASHRR